MIRFDCCCNFQKYDLAIEKLNEVYFPDSTNITAVKRANIDLMSALYFNYGIFKAVVYQSAFIGFVPKKTFLSR